MPQSYLGQSISQGIITVEQHCRASRAGNRVSLLAGLLLSVAILQHHDRSREKRWRFFIHHTYFPTLCSPDWWRVSVGHSLAHSLTAKATLGNKLGAFPIWQLAGEWNVDTPASGTDCVITVPFLAQKACPWCRVGDN